MAVRSLIRVLVVALLGAVFVIPASNTAAQATPEGNGDNPFIDLGLPQIDVTMTDIAFEGMPSELAAGRYVVALTNEASGTTEPGFSAGGSFLQIPDGMSADEFLAMVSPPEGTPDAAMESEGSPAASEGDNEIPAWFYQVTMVGGPFASVGETAYAVVDLNAGNWIFWAEDPEAAQPLVQVTVSGELPTDAPTPAADVRVEMSEFSFSFSDTLTAGTHVIEIANVGEQPHFMQIGTVPAGTTAEDVHALLESLFSGPGDAPAATPENGLALEDIQEVFNMGNQSAGETTWHEVTLAPGTYVAMCFIPDVESGAPHAMLGMIEIFEVS